jgi:hypothetical protein
MYVRTKPNLADSIADFLVIFTFALSHEQLLECTEVKGA